MTRDNNYTEISELRRVQDDIMEAISYCRHIEDKSLPVDELHLVAQSINDKQRKFRERLHAYLKGLAECTALLDELERREDLLQAECFGHLRDSLEDAGEARAHMVSANRKQTSWIARNLDGLKSLFQKVSA